MGGLAAGKDGFKEDFIVGFHERNDIDVGIDLKNKHHLSGVIGATNDIQQMPLFRQVKNYFFKINSAIFLQPFILFIGPVKNLQCMLIRHTHYAFCTQSCQCPPRNIDSIRNICLNQTSSYSIQILMEERRTETDMGRAVLGAAGRVRRGGELRADDNIFFRKRVEEQSRKPNIAVVQDIVRLQHANVLKVVEEFRFPKGKFGSLGIPDLERSVETVARSFTIAQLEEVCRFEQPLFVIDPEYNFEAYLAGIARKSHGPEKTLLARIMDRLSRSDLERGLDREYGPVVSNYVRKRLAFMDARDSLGEEGFNSRFGFVEGKPRLHGDTVHEGQSVKDRLEELRATLPKGVSVLRPKTAAWLHMHGVLNGVEFNTMRDGVLDDGLKGQDRFLTHSTYEGQFRILESFDPDTTLAACFNTRKEVMSDGLTNIFLEDFTPVPKVGN